MNSWMGVFYFLIVGIGSKRFRTVIAGNVMQRVRAKYKWSLCK